MRVIMWLHVGCGLFCLGASARAAVDSEWGLALALFMVGVLAGMTAWSYREDLCYENKRAKGASG